MTVSFNPETFKSGGGFEGPQTLISARFAEYDFNGKGTPQVGLVLTLVNENGKTSKQFYGVGNSADRGQKFAAIDGGKKIQPVGKDEALNDSCKTAILIRELVNAGFPVESLEGGDISALDGLHAEWAQKTMKEILGREFKVPGSDKEATLLVPTSIYLLPGDDATEEHSRFEASEVGGKSSGTAAMVKAKAAQKVAATKSAPKASAKPAAAKDAPVPANDGVSNEDAAAMAILEVLATNDGTIPKAKLTGAIIKAVPNDNPAKGQIVKLAMSNDYLNSREEWSFADGVLTAS